MFEWKVEEMKLMNTSKYNEKSNKKAYLFENSISKEDKIKFVDEHQQGKLSTLLNLCEKFEKDKKELPKDNCGHVKTVSLIAWIKRNNAESLIDSRFHYGYIRFLCERNITRFNERGPYDTFENFIDEAFHRQLLECEKAEKKYFLEHDEYSILKSKLKESMNKHATTFGVRIGYSTSGEVFIYSNDEECNIHRPITISEINLLLSKYEILEKTINDISNEINIVY